jgi:predicted O-methyltransferase YrrM
MEKYRYTQKWFLGSEIRRKLHTLLSKTAENTMLEIGSFEGLSSVFFADNFLDHPDSTLTCVDPFMKIAANDHEIYLKNGAEANFDYNISVCKHPQKITVHKQLSDDFFASNNKTYNFIYVDGCHEPEVIARDMENALASLTVGGIMWMDDYLGGDGKKIKSTMDAFLMKHREVITIIHKGYQLATKRVS